MSRTSAVVGNHLILSSLLALLSYVPFEYVAKGSIVMAAVLFVTDPIPPVGRMIALLSVIVVGVLSRLRKEHGELHDPNNGVTLEVIEEEPTVNDVDKKKEK
jgi:hypothetical protein